MKNSSDTIGNRTRDLPACSAVPQPTAPPRAPPPLMSWIGKIFTFFLLRTVTSINVMCKYCGSVLGFESNYRFQYCFNYMTEF